MNNLRLPITKTGGKKMRLGLSVRKPHRGLSVFNESFDKIIRETANALSIFGVDYLEKGSWAPSLDVVETEESYKLRADLPGLKKEDIQIDVKDNTLTIKGEKKLEGRVAKDDYVRVEREYGTFSRSFTLSDNINPENIKANYKDGVVEVTLPKREESKPKQIKVEVN
jgi:HSP20 family protein